MSMTGRPSGCLGGFRRLVALAPDGSRGPLFPGLPQSSLPAGTPQFSLLQELSTAVIRVRHGPAISQSSSSSVGRPVYSLSLSLSAPLSRNPASLSQRAPSGLPEPMTQLEQQGSSLALTRLLVITAIIYNNVHSSTSYTLTRSFDNSQFRSRLNSPTASCLLSAGAAHPTLMV